MRTAVAGGAQLSAVRQGVSALRAGGGGAGHLRLKISGRTDPTPTRLDPHLSLFVLLKQSAAGREGCAAF